MPWITPIPGQPVENSFPQGFMDVWQRLAVSTNQADPVCCAPAWQLSFHEIFTPERRIFYSASSMGLLIFAEYIGQDGKIILLPLEDSWLFGRPLLGNNSALLLADAMPELAEEYKGKLPDFIISGIMEPSFFASSLFQRFYPAYTFYRQDCCAQASASLSGGIEGWFSRRSPNHRAKLRKAIKHAKYMGIEFERWRPTPQNAAEIYNRILAVEQRSWKGINKCGMSESPSREFYECLLFRHVQKKSALVIFARHENTDIGFIFGGICGSIYRGQQFSYDADYAKLSLGNILQYNKITWLCELGIKRYDMGPVTGERMQYKEHWTEQFTKINTWIMRREKISQSR